MIDRLCNVDWTGLAAWVQAVGSVIAILVAVGLFWAQARHESRARRADAVGTLVNALWAGAALIIEAQRMLEEGAEKVRTSSLREAFFSGQYDGWFFSSVRDSLVSHQFSDGTGGGFVKEYYSCIRAISGLVVIFDGIAAGEISYSATVSRRIGTLLRDLEAHKVSLVAEIQVVESFKYAPSHRDRFLQRFNRYSRRAGTNLWNVLRIFRFSAR